MPIKKISTEQVLPLVKRLATQWNTADLVDFATESVCSIHENGTGDVSSSTIPLLTDLLRKVIIPLHVGGVNNQSLIAEGIIDIYSADGITGITTIINDVCNAAHEENEHFLIGEEQTRALLAGISALNAIAGYVAELFENS